MGTRSTTTFYDGEKPVWTFYRQYDGYPEGHGLELAAALAGRKMAVGGDIETMGVHTLNLLRISSDPLELASGFYIEDPASVGHLGEEYLYRVTGIPGEEPRITCLTERGAVVVSCPVSEFEAEVKRVMA